MCKRKLEKMQRGRVTRALLAEGRASKKLGELRVAERVHRPAGEPRRQVELLRLGN